MDLPERSARRSPPPPTSQQTHSILHTYPRIYIRLLPPPHPTFPNRAPKGEIAYRKTATDGATPSHFFIFYFFLSPPPAHPLPHSPLHSPGRIPLPYGHSCAFCARSVYSATAASASPRDTDPPYSSLHHHQQQQQHATFLPFTPLPTVGYVPPAALPP